uniref:Uncharacterized protein n=1 Tax=Setaria italica TaxID=4555 RepID=K3YP25_SETIT
MLRIDACIHFRCILQLEKYESIDQQCTGLRNIEVALQKFQDL